MLALLPNQSVRHNLALPLFNRLPRWGRIPTTEQPRVTDAINQLPIDIRAGSQVRRLSGGNQQKVMIGRWPVSGFRTLLCFDPTRGIDIQTKRDIYALLRKLAAQGAAILLYTTNWRRFLWSATACSSCMRDASWMSRTLRARGSSLLTAAHGLEAPK